MRAAPSRFEATWLQCVDAAFPGRPSWHDTLCSAGPLVLFVDGPLWSGLLLGARLIMTRYAPSRRPARLGLRRTGSREGGSCGDWQICSTLCEERPKRRPKPPHMASGAASHGAVSGAGGSDVAPDGDHEAEGQGETGQMGSVEDGQHRKGPAFMCVHPGSSPWRQTRPSCTLHDGLGHELRIAFSSWGSSRDRP